MKKWHIIILILLTYSGATAQEKFPVANKRQYWKGLSSIYRHRKASESISYLQQMIDFAKSQGRYGMAIYYELLLGDEYEKMDDYGIAEGIFIAAYEEAKKYRPAKHRIYGDYLITAAQQKTFFDPIDRLGYFYLSVGNLKNAEQLFQESRTLRNQFFPRLSIHRVHPEVGLGSYYFRKGQYAKTYEQFNKAGEMIARATTTGYDFDILNRLFLNDLVELCLILGKEKESFKYLNLLAAASSGFGKFGSPASTKIEIARVYELKARCYLVSGDKKKAREYLDRAIHYNPSSSAASAVKLKLLRTAAILNWYESKYDDAAKSFQSLVETYRDHIQENFAAMSDYEREQFYFTLKDDFDLFNGFVLANPDAASGALIGQVYNNILNTKALLLNETNHLKNQILHSGNQSLIDKLNQWESEKDQLAALYFEKNTPAQIDALEKSIETLERDINKSSGLFPKKEKSLTWQDVKAGLKEGEAAIEILRVNTFDKSNPKKSVIRNGLTDSTVYMFLMVTSTSDKPETFYLYNGNHLENHFLPYYRNSILAKTDDKLSYENFWRTIKYMNGTKRIYLSADGVYNQINLNALRNPTTQNYLIDEIELVLLTNTGDLLSPQSTGQSNDAFLIGRPAFEFSQAQISTALSSPSISLTMANGTRSLTSEELINFKGQDFADLPGTEEEVSKIGTVLKSQNIKVTTYIGADALEENVKALKKPGVLHIATHGFFVEDTASSINPMIRSGIILAGVRNETGKSREDGILTAYEATNLDLENTDLVALSACQTGLGEVKNGEESTDCNVQLWLPELKTC